MQEKPESTNEARTGGVRLSDGLGTSKRLKFFGEMVKDGWGFCLQCGITGIDEDGTCPTCGASAIGQALTALAEDILAGAYVFFHYCPECGFDTCATAEEAIAAAEGHLDHYRDEAGDGWSETVTSICWGEVKQEACETERRPRTPNHICDPSFDEIVDYGLRGIAQAGSGVEREVRRMRISQQEQMAIKQAVEAGEAFGFGNLISHMQTAWAKMLVDNYQMSEETARLSSGGSGYPFKMHEDLKERGFWDESGESYIGSE